MPAVWLALPLLPCPQRMTPANLPPPVNSLESAHRFARIFLTDVAVAFTAGVAGISLGANAVAADGGAGQLQDLDGGAPTAMGSVKVTDGEPLSEEAARIQRKLAAQVLVVYASRVQAR